MFASSFQRLALIAVVFCLSHSSTDVVNAQFVSKANWVPGHANSLILVNADRLYSSELAKRENWSETRAGAFERGLSLVPPQVGSAMFASQIDVEHMEPVWTVAVLLDAKSDVAALAKNSEREVERILDMDAVMLPDDLYVVQLSPGTIGVNAPADRQATVRWLKDGQSNKARLSSYLMGALEFADKNADVIIAIDLEHVVSEAEARSKLLTSEKVKATDIEQIAASLSKLHGLTLGVTVRDKIVGALRIDFESGTQGIEKITKDLVLEVLGNRGVMIDDFLDWELSTESSRLVFRGPLSTRGLRQIGSLVNQPIRAQFSNTASVESPGSATMSVGKCSRHYLDSLDLFFRELDEQLQKPKTATAKVYARWFDKYANKIDSLPAGNVDPKLLELGGSISRGFREISGLLFGAEATTVSRKASERNYGSYYGYGYYNGYYGYRSSRSVNKVVTAQEYARAAQQAKDVMNQIRTQLGDARREAAKLFPGDF